MFRDIRAPIVTYSRNLNARALAVLPAGGAFDSAPKALTSQGFLYMLLLGSYVRGAAGGAINFKIEVLLPDVSASEWYWLTTYKQGTVTAGADTVSNVQRESFTFQSGGAGSELFVYGPVLLGGNVEQVRIVAREIGVTATPGQVRLEARFA